MAVGWLHVICGPMFSGKTEEMVRLLRRADIAGRRVLVISPAVDARAPDGLIKSRAGGAYAARSVASSGEIEPLVRSLDPQLIAVSEAQFFDAGLPAVLDRLASSGVVVIAEGLDLDFLGRSFGPLPELLARADQVTKLTAICVQCGADATRSQRLVDGRPATAADPLIVLGGMGDDRYEARCRACHALGEAAD